MRQIRQNVFETNSSSTHSIVICTQEEFEKFVHGNLVYDNWERGLVPVPSAEDYDRRYSSYDELGDTGYGSLDTYEEYFTTPSGDKMVVFGCYGYDG